jgi:hypothetical protein
VWEVYVSSIAKLESSQVAETRAESRSSDDEPALFIAVVHADDGVRFMTAADSRRELVHRVAEYVREWGGYLLRPDHARHLRGLLARGEWEAAVELYFGLVGKRWDKEWLVTAAVSTSDRRDVVAVLGEIALPDALADRRARGESSGDTGPSAARAVNKACGLYLDRRQPALG